jgi:glycerol-3-phosphate dehydrogenase (NAD(P)+)
MHLPFTSAAILGAGSLGTALAKLLAPKLESILLVSIETECVEGINREHRNPRYLTSIQLGSHIRATSEHREALAMPLVIFAVPLRSDPFGGRKTRGARFAGGHPVAVVRQGHRTQYR